MPIFLKILLYVALIGSVTSSIYCLLVVVAAVRYGMRRRQALAGATQFLPPVSVLKPLHGTEPSLERNLETFFVQEYPEYEVLFCARHANDAGLMLAQQVAERYPAVKARFITCGEPEFPNAKMWSLAALAEAACYETLVTSDADARVSRTYLRECVQGLADGAELESCVYVGQTDGGFASALDAVGKSVEMTGGVLVADMLEGTRFALGVTMVLRREGFALAGGYEELGQYFAEDFVLGSRLAEAGHGVRISKHVIRLMVPPMGFAESFRNQMRWMKSTRRSRPAGHFGTGATFALPFGLMGLVWGLLSGHWAWGLLWLLGTCVNRWVLAAVVLWALGDEHAAYEIAIYPVRDLLGAVLWAGSYWGSTMSYHGGKYQLEKGGRFKRRS